MQRPMDRAYVIERFRQFLTMHVDQEFRQTVMAGPKELEAAIAFLEADIDAEQSVDDREWLLSVGFQRNEESLFLPLPPVLSVLHYNRSGQFVLEAVDTCGSAYLIVQQLKTRGQLREFVRRFGVELPAPLRGIAVNAREL